MKKTILLLNCLLVVGLSYGQSSFEQVAAIFDANCNSSCHNGAGPGESLNLQTADLSDLYNELVNATPVNPSAAGKGYKLIDPGHPLNSYLLRKVAFEEWDAAYDLEIADGNSMPDGQPHISKEDAELVRQWIIRGAPQSGNVVDTDIIHDYYNVNGMARMEPLPAPAPEDGFQIHFGPIFLDAGEETEYYLKHRLYNEEEQKVIRLDDVFNDESHHFLLFEFTNGSQSLEPDGLRPVTNQNAFQDAEYVVGWVDSDSTILPEGTAYYFPENAVLDLNYHLINYASNGDSILAAEVYVNCLVDNDSEGLQQMHSDLLIYPVFQFFIPNDGNPHVFTDAVYETSSEDTVNIWMLSTHTHKYGTDYDIFKRTPGGEKGEQLYEGFFNTEYTFNQGYYDWEHPGKRYFEPLEPVEWKYGIIQEAEYLIDNPDEPANIIFFGLTTDDEMMLTFIQYTLQSETPEPPSGIADSNPYDQEMLVAYPNPFTDDVNIVFNVKDNVDMRLEVFNTLGQSVQILYDGENVPGGGMATFKPVGNHDPQGVYLVRLTTPDNVFSARIIQSK